jgi:nucleoside-diphosphate-sugar epimerase
MCGRCRDVSFAEIGEDQMRVLLTGGAGYIGAILTPMLLKRGYEVRLVDSGIFGFDTVPADVELIKKDILFFDDSWLKGVDVVLHLAGLSNDPMAELFPHTNYLTNAAGTAIIAEASKRAGIQRFIFASTCSVYGLADKSIVDEETIAQPRFPYGISKLMAERSLECLADDEFRPIMLRKGTVVGWSPRMRFDLVVNTMIKTALTQKKITVHNPSLWRPLLDVQDAAEAYLRAVDADEDVSGTFNIAYDNFTIGRLADEVAEALREFDIDVSLEIQKRRDVRSYRVSTQKAVEVLDYHPRVSMKDSAREIIRNLVTDGHIDLENPKYVNVEWMKLTMENGLKVVG